MRKEYKKGEMLDENTKTIIAGYVEQYMREWLEEKYYGEAKPTAAKINGYVYVISMGELYKIGRTSNITRRLQAFSIFPEEPKLVLYAPAKDCVALEAELHDLLEHKCVRGEWFRLDEKDLEWVKKFILSYEGQRKLPRRPKGW